MTIGLRPPRLARSILLMADSAVDFRRSLATLLGFCRRESWRGYDPYDGLSSPLSRILPEGKFFRTALTQLVKRSALNLRPLLGIRKDFNSKGVALAGRAITMLAARDNVALPEALSMGGDGGDELRGDFRLLFGTLLSLKSPGFDRWCWGYNFDWQSRAFFAPRLTPNVVCTVFAAQAMLDWHEATGSSQALEIAESSCRFLLEEINRTSDGESFCFSYTPIDRSVVHNVNMLAAELLARLYSKTGEAQICQAARSAISYTLKRQRPDGSWPYGEGAHQQWIDSFHTGFILVSLKRAAADLGCAEWHDALSRGYDFYRDRFFLADATPRYYHDSLYPIDVHSAAQAVITFSEMTDLMSNAKVLAGRAVEWAIRNLQDPAGYFYFQRNRLLTIKIPYMRWGQAWMLYALSLYLTRSMEGEDV